MAALTQMQCPLTWISGCAQAVLSVSLIIVWLLLHLKHIHYLAYFHRKAYTPTLNIIKKILSLNKENYIFLTDFFFFSLRIAN